MLLSNDEFFDIFGAVDDRPIGPVFPGSYEAVKAGLQPGEVFYVPNVTAGGYETRRVVDQPGEYLTRGDFGTLVYSETAIVYEPDGYVRPAMIGETPTDWAAWDVDFGWVGYW